MSRYAGRRFTVDSRGVGRRYAGRLAATLAVGVLGASPLAACSGAPGADAPTRPATSAASVVVLPTADATSLVSSSGSTTGFDVLANIPAAAKQHTNAGAQAFARYYIEAVGRLLMDPAKGQLSKLYLPECQECLQVARHIDEGVDQRIRWQDLYYRVLDVTMPDLDSTSAGPEKHVALAARVTTNPVGVTSGSAPPTTRPKGADVLIKFGLAWNGDQWLVADFQSQVAPTASR
ncbi:MAG: hypothetical protein IPK37_02360 [Austwickia sp.]|nr:MAG: hypothetical protein IPK37_02360 [Austwickia sp.]